MEFNIIYAAVIVVIIGAGKAESEPRCYSNFDFQEKLLEKMVVLSNKMDNFEKVFAIKQQELDDHVNQIKTDRSKMESDITGLVNDVKNEVRHKTQSQLKSQKESMAAMEKRIDDLMTTSEAKIARLSTDVHEYTNKSRKSLQALLKESVKPNVAFLARALPSKAPNTNAKLRFTTTLVNTEDCYSTETGEFVSPFNGTYWFSTQICGYSKKYVNFRIYVNDVMMSDTTQYDGDSSYDCTTANIVAILSKGDKVYVKTGPNTSSGNAISQDTYNWSMFMGALIN